MQQQLNTPEELRAIRQAMDEGKNPLVVTDVPRWEDQVGISRIVNRRVLEFEVLPTPAQVLGDLPLSDQAQEIVAYSRDEIRACLYGQDDRLLVIVGPCSVHDPAAALDYARRLAALKDELAGELLIVMRVYFEKPRTTVGWKGLINDPDIDGSCNIKKGLLLARRTFPMRSAGVRSALATPKAKCTVSSLRACRCRLASRTPPMVPSKRRPIHVLLRLNSTRSSVSITWVARPWSKRSATPTAMWCCVVRAAARTMTPNPWRTP